MCPVLCSSLVVHLLYVVTVAALLLRASSATVTNVGASEYDVRMFVNINSSVLATAAAAVLLLQ